MSLVLAAALVLGVLTACGSGGDPEVVRVFAAASLSDVLPALGTAFTEREGTRVRFAFDGSSGLVRQLRDGAPADVLITADQVTMDAAVAQRVVTGETIIIARNRLGLVVEAGNPKEIAGLGDLTRDGVRFVMCAAVVPCGRLGDRALARAGVGARPASREQDVKAAVAKVRLGEADAALAYETDARGAGGELELVTLPLAAEPDLQAVYVMARTSTARPGPAGRWESFLASAPARAILATAGFVAP